MKLQVDARVLPKREHGGRDTRMRLRLDVGLNIAIGRGSGSGRLDVLYSIRSQKSAPPADGDTVEPEGPTFRAPAHLASSHTCRVKKIETNSNL